MTAIAGSRAPATFGKHAGPPDRGRRRHVRVALLMATLVLALFVAAGSYGHALGAPGSDGAGAKTSAWVHHHHLDPVASALKSWLQARHRSHDPS